MKKFYFLAFLGLLAIHFNGYGAKEVFYGNQTFGKETIDSIQANGCVILEGTQALGNGEVWLSDDSEASGPIIGAKIVRKAIGESKIVKLGG